MGAPVRAGVEVAEIIKAAGDGDFLVYVASPVLATVQVQLLKADYRRAGRKASPWKWRALSCVSSGALSMFFGWRLAGWSLDRAVDAGVLVAVAYPTILYLILRVLKKRDPQAARDLVGGDDMPTELQGAPRLDGGNDESPDR